MRAPSVRPDPIARGRLVDRRMVGQLGRYLAVGLLSTGLQVGLYLLLRGELGPLTANLVSLVLSSAANLAANRRATFGISGRHDAARHYLQGLLVFGLSLGLTSGALGLLDLLAPSASRSAELVLVLSANAVVTVARFALLRGWVFTDPRS
jgi:putative flippase GtrA